MDFREKLALGHSKLFTHEVANEILNHPEKINDLIQIFIEGPVQFTQRAAWVISVIAEVNKDASFKRHEQGWVDEIISNLDELVERVKLAKNKKEVVVVKQTGLHMATQIVQY